MPGLRLTTADAVRSLINLLVQAVQREASSSAAALVRIDRLPTTPDEELLFSLRKLEPGMHPMAVLDGFVAPPAWAGIGLIAAGRLQSVDEPDGARGRGRVILVLARDGVLGSALCQDDQVHVSVGPVSAGALVGDLALALCRALGVPCAPDPGDTSGDP